MSGEPEKNFWKQFRRGEVNIFSGNFIFHISPDIWHLSPEEFSNA